MRFQALVKVRVIFDVIEIKVKMTGKINQKQNLCVKHEVLVKVRVILGLIEVIVTHKTKPGRET